MIDATALGLKRKSEYRIAHLSDLHISADRSEFRCRWRSWVGASHSKGLLHLQAIVRDLAAAEVDHVVITGDLTTGAQDVEIEALKQALGKWLDPEKLTLVPGNHDVSYRHGRWRRRQKQVPRKLSNLAHHFPEFLSADHPSPLNLRKRRAFPLCRVLDAGRIALIGLDTTGGLPITWGPFNSFGHISRAQFHELRALLRSPWIHDRLKIVAMHHHPLIVPVFTLFDGFLQLFQAKQLLDLLYEHGVDMVLHGHKHHPFCWQSHTLHGHDLTVICAGPPDAYANGKSSDLVYNIYSVNGSQIDIHYRRCPPTVREKPKINHICARKTHADTPGGNGGIPVRRSLSVGSKNGANGTQRTPAPCSPGGSRLPVGTIASGSQTPRK
jgi:3',5'-cyclic AMP phosphodiesterase CpdA